MKKATRVLDTGRTRTLDVKQNGVNAETWKRAQDRLVGRNVKQCRERWCNQLIQMSRKGNGPPLEEEELTVQLQRHIGNKSQIASTLTGRTDNLLRIIGTETESCKSA